MRMGKRAGTFWFVKKVAWPLLPPAHNLKTLPQCQTNLPAPWYNAGMSKPRRPQFRVRTLLLITTLLAVVFAVCAQWPVTETRVTLNSENGMIYQRVAYEKRTPTVSEWARRAGPATAVLVGLVVAIAWRSRSRPATH